MLLHAGLSLVASRGGYPSLRCTGLSLQWPLPLRSTGSRRQASAVVGHGLSCSAACGIFLDQGSNLCPLHWQADSQPLRHQGSPDNPILKWAKDLNRHIPNEGIQIANNIMKRCSISLVSLVIKEMQVKTTMRCYFAPTRMAIVKKKKIDNTNCW